MSPYLHYCLTLSWKFLELHPQLSNKPPGLLSNNLLSKWNDQEEFWFKEWLLQLVFCTFSWPSRPAEAPDVPEFRKFLFSRHDCQSDGTRIIWIKYGWKLLGVSTTYWVLLKLRFWGKKIRTKREEINLLLVMYESHEYWDERNSHVWLALFIKHVPFNKTLNPLVMGDMWLYMNLHLASIHDLTKLVDRRHILFLILTTFAQ